jgi:L-ascorbate metabolism protein UlaG (beta-lactamase superfamily)
MITPYLAGDTFLTDVARARSEPDFLHIWWLGQSGFLLQWEGHHLLFDPYLSDSLTVKYAQTDKPHVRMTERVIAPDRLDFIDVVTSSHNHTDHLDAETLVPLLAANPALKVIVPEANRAFAADRLGVAPETFSGLVDGATVRAADFSVTGLPAAHEELALDAAGHHLFMGYIVKCGPWSIYHSGDTLLYPGLVERLQPAAIDIALLPINGSRPERRVAGNLNGEEAAQLARQMGAGLVIPCHYEMFEFNSEPPDRFVAACQRLGQPHQVLRAGERRSAAKDDE